jgi:gliding motility-associated-like protein
VYTYTITPPTITLPADDGSTVACIGDAQVVPIPPVVNNSCGDPATVTGPVVSPDPVCSGPKTYTWTYTDCTGTTAQWVYTYTISASTFTLPAPGASNVPCVGDAQVVPTPPVVTNSCGDLVTPTGPVVGPDPVCAGTKVYTWTFTDCDGTMLDWTYTYTIPSPTITLPPDEGSTVSCIGDAQVVPTPPVVTNSCGDPVIPTGPVVGADPVCSGTKTYIWSYVDCNGGSADWIYTYTILPAAFTLPIDDGATVGCIADAQVVPVPPSANNSCGDPLTLTGPVISPDPVCSGVKTYVWTYTDCAGNTSQWTYTYTITPPTFTLPADDGSTVGCLLDAQIQPTPPAATNSCGDALTLTGPVIGADPVCSGTKTYTWTFTDCTGTSGQWVYTYSIAPPTLSMPADGGSTVACVSDAQVVPTPPVVNNSCGDPAVVTGPVVSADPVCSGTKTYTWTYTDCTGANIPWVYTYTVTPPTLSLPADDGSTVACVSDAQVIPANPTVNNSCGDPLTITGPVVGADPVCAGAKTYTWTYTDCSGASADWIYTYTVMPSIFNLPADDGSTVPCSSDAQTVPIPPVVTNACGDPIAATGPVISADPACSGTKTYVWTFTDCGGASLDWTYTYTITGDSGPVFVAPPGDVSVPCVADVPAMIDLSYTNDCSGGGTVTGSDSAINGACPATITRTWTVTDACGNVATETQTITINDVTPPTASNPAPINVAGCNAALPVPDIVVVIDADDNCGVPTVAFVSDASLLVGCIETTTRTFSVTDDCNNSITVTQTITRTVDTIPPVLTAPADLTVDCIAQVPPIPDLTYTDNCSPGGTIVGTETPPSGTPLTIIRTWTVTDDCGNAATVTQTITITQANPVTDLTDSFCEGTTYILPDSSTTMNGGMYGPYTFVGQGGCDSIVNLDLTELIPDTTYLVDSFCEGTDYTLPDGSMTTDGGMFGPYPFTGANTCDSIVYLDLTEVPVVTNDIVADFCEGTDYTLPDSSTTNSAGNYGPYIFLGSNGCDSIVNLMLDMIDTSEIHLVDEICLGDPYTLPDGSTPAASGMYGPYIFTGAGGCDSTIYVDLTIFSGGDSLLTNIGCEGDGFSVVVNGTTYDENTPDGIETFPGPGGCDSVVTIQLVFHPTSTGNEDYLGCSGDGYNVVVGGTVYDESNPIGTDTLVNSLGCDSVVTVNLVFQSFAQAVIDAPGPVCTTAGVQTLTATPTGGTWSGSVNSDQFDPALLGVGTHEVIYTVNPGACQSADTIDISVYELILSCQATQDESAPGANDGEGEVTVSGGVAPYTVTWTGPVSGSIVLNADGSFVITSLAAGVYTIEVEDASGVTCTATCQFTVGGTLPCDLTLNPLVIQDATCPGINNGAISASATGSMPPFEYSLDGITYQSSPVFSALAPGTYTVYVRDVALCVDTENGVVGVGPGPQLDTIEVIDASCGIANGSIEVFAVNGTTPYTYSIDGIVYGLSGLFPGLGAGTYPMYVIDAAGCTDTLPVIVEASGAPVIDDIIIEDATCGNADGSIMIVASGGVPPYMYSINGGVSFQSSDFFGSLLSGSYPIVVEDAMGCQITDNATIQNVGGPVIDAIVTVPTTCGQTDGSITVTATGVPSLMYSINGTTYQTSSVFLDQPNGNYTVYVKDGNGCITTQMVTITTTDGPQLISIVETNTNCGEDDGTILITATGGTGDLEYLLNGDSYGDQNFIGDLEAGTYVVVVEDENGCTASGQVTIDDSELPDFDEYPVTAHCGQPDGQIEVEGFDGVSPYTFSFNGGNFGSTTVWTGLISDFYTIVVMDAEGCIYERDVFVPDRPAPVISSVQISLPGCGLFDGAIEVSTPAPYPGQVLMYSIQLPFYQASPIFDPVAPGTYTINVKDQFGCQATPVTVTINPNPVPTIANINVVDTDCGLTNGEITVTATGGSTPYMYSIDGVTFISMNMFTSLGAGTYTVTVRGANGCEVSQDVTIISFGSQESDLADVFCAGTTYSLHDSTFTSPGIYDVLVPGGAANGCDSTIHLDLSELPLLQDTTDESICVGDIYTINGMDYTTAGIYLIDTLTASAGCDTILYLQLTVNPLDTTYLNETICTGGVYTIGGIDYTMAGTYFIDTIPAAAGCDSIRFLVLAVADYNTDTIVSILCEGEVFTYNGIDYSTTNIYTLDTLTGPGGCDTILALDLTINTLPTANAGADQILDCAMQSVTLNGSVTGGTPLWTGPGIDASNEGQLMPVVTQPGVYYLTASTPPNCSAVDSVTVTLDPSTVIADAGADAFISCDIDTIILQAGPSGTDLVYQWTGPGINASNEHSLNPVITLPGIYTLVVTDTATQCVSLPDTVFIDDIRVVIIAIIQDPVDSLNCYITEVDLEATGSSVGPNIVYTWFDSDGNLVISSPGFPVSSGGMWTLVVEDTISGCFDNDSIFVEDLTEYPPADAGSPQIIDCNNPTVILNEGATSTFPHVLFHWTGPSGGIIGADSLLSVLVGIPGYYYHLMALDTATGCQNMDSVFVEDLTAPPSADANLVENITCIDSIALLNIGTSDAGPDISHNWFGPGTNNVLADSIEPVLPGQYILTVTNQLTGCLAMDSVSLALPQEPSDMLADIDIPFCEGDNSGTLTINNVTGGIPVYMYSINGETAQSSPVFDSLSAGIFNISVIDGNGCTYMETFTVVDGQPLTIDIGPDIFLELGDSVILWADVSLPWSMIDSIVWTPLEILSCDYCTNPVLHALHDDIISAYVYSGGCRDSDMLALTVDVDADIYIPNVFSPNDDGINDHVTVFTDDRVKRVVYLEIFDRWGNQVFVGEDFEPNDPLKGWDGSFRGKKMNPAVFAYIARVELINGDQVNRKGDITLLR